MSKSPKQKDPFDFPPVSAADRDGLLAFGGDLSAERLIRAYESGIFPWFNPGQQILWWSPPKRMVLFPEKFKVSKSLRQRIRSKKFEVRMDTCFDKVIRHCADIKRKDQPGTWITEEMIAAYTHLHHLGFAHSIETFEGDQLVGGLYGVSLGSAFFGESMFSISTDASKIAFYTLCEFAKNSGISLIDCQLHTDHLARLGAEEIERSDYLDLLENALAHDDLKGPWQVI